MKTLSLFTYGTLQFPKLMHAITGKQFQHESAVLHDYAAYQVLGEPYPALIPQAGTTTPGILYHNIDAQSFMRLDAYEDDIYQKCDLPVTLQNGVQVRASVYVTRPEFRHRVSKLNWDMRQFEKNCLNIYQKKFGLQP